MSAKILQTCGFCMWQQYRCPCTSSGRYLPVPECMLVRVCVRACMRVYCPIGTTNIIMIMLLAALEIDLIMVMIARITSHTERHLFTATCTSGCACILISQFL